MEKIVLIGGGGHCKVIIDIIKQLGQFEIAGICDFNAGEEILGVPIIGDDSILPQLYKEGITNAFICIGALGNPNKRIKIADDLRKIGFKMPVLKHPKACISQFCKVGEGTCIMAGAVINPDTKIGKLCIINTGSIIEHDCIIGDNVHISPRACLCGGVTVENNAHIGAGSVVNQGITIGNKSIIGSGAVVIKDIKEGVTAVGVPAKIYSK